MRWGWAVWIVAALLIVAMFLAHRDQPIRPTVISGMAMGTHYHIKLAGARPPRDGIERDVQVLMEEIQVQASQWRELSWVSRFNAGDSLQPVPVPAHVWAMLLVAEEVYHQSGGLVDVTVGPLVQLWGSGHEPNTVSPPDEEVARTLARCGFDKLVLEPPARTVRRTVPGVQIDLSSLAKGYAVDRIDGLLQSYGLGNYVIEFGGEVLARGGRASVSEQFAGWNIRLPGQHGQTQTVTAINTAYATSGGSEQNHEIDGVTVTHLIHPRTGRPVADATGAVTVTADRCIIADAWATALSVTTKAEAQRLAEEADIGLMDWRD